MFYALLSARNKGECVSHRFDLGEIHTRLCFSPSWEKREEGVKNKVNTLAGLFTLLSVLKTYVKNQVTEYTEHLWRHPGILFLTPVLQARGITLYSIRPFFLLCNLLQDKKGTAPVDPPSLLWIDWLSVYRIIIIGAYFALATEHRAVVPVEGLAT